MKAARVRVTAFVVALAASELLLLLWAADADWHAPLSPQATRAIAGDEFRPIFGSAMARDGRLHVIAGAEDHSALQSIALGGATAGEFPILRYRFENFPRTMELALVFRTAEQPADVQVVALPWPGAGSSSFDLSRVAAWRGAIVELGFSEFATAQNVAPELGFRPFALAEAELWSASWHGDFAALATDWLGSWPWSQRSVHALGRDTDSPRAPSIVVSVALAAAAAIVWALLLLGRRRRTGAVLASLALAWLALDLVWQAGLVQRLQATRSLYAQVAWPERARIVGDSDILAAADEVKALLANEPPQTRVLVTADSGYQLLRMVWHLLPLNASPLVLATASGSELPEGSVIVLLGKESESGNPTFRKLLAGSRRISSPHRLHADGFEDGRVTLFRYRRAR